MNLFILIASNIASDRKKGDDLFCIGEHHFFGQHSTISDIINHYFMAAFTQFWLKTCINFKYLKKSAAHSLGYRYCFYAVFQELKNFEFFQRKGILFKPLQYFICCFQDNLVVSIKQKVDKQLFFKSSVFIVFSLQYFLSYYCRPLIKLK